MQDENSQPDPTEITLGDLDGSASRVPPSSNDVRVSWSELNAAFSRVTEENATLKEENERLKSTAETVQILNKLMKPSADKAFYYMFSYSGAVGLMLLMNAFGCFQIPLDPDVMKFLVGSTAVTVIGLVGMVLTGLFVGARNR